MDNTNKKLSSREIAAFFSLYHMFDELFGEIINYIPDILLPNEFKICGATFSVGKDELCIELTDSYYEDRDYFYLPLNVIINDTWKPYIDGMAQAQIDKRNKQKEAEKAYKEKEELEEYKRLKEKFEKK